MSLSSSETSWTQPILSANGTVGGNNFAITVSSEQNPTTYAGWHMFDGNSSSYWQTTQKSNWFCFYNPTPLRVTKIKTIAYNTNYNMQTVLVEGSNNYTSWTTITSTIDTISNPTQTVSLTNTKFYKYYRVSSTSINNAICIYTTTITATQQTSALNSITFPCSHTAGNTYSYNFAYYGDYTESWATVKNKSGLSLQVIGTPTSGYYLTIGY